MPCIIWSWPDNAAEDDDPIFHCVTADLDAAVQWVVNRDWTILERHEKARPAITWGEHRKQMRAIATGRASVMTMATFDDPGPLAKDDSDIYIRAYPATTFFCVQCDGMHVATFQAREEAQDFITDRERRLRDRSGRHYILRDRSGPYYIDAVEGG